MAVNSLKAAWDTLKNPDIKGWERLSSLMMSFGMGVPMLISGFSQMFGGMTEGLGKAVKRILETKIANDLMTASIEKNTLAELKNCASKKMMDIVSD